MRRQQLAGSCAPRRRRPLRLGGSSGSPSGKRDAAAGEEVTDAGLARLAVDEREVVACCRTARTLRRPARPAPAGSSSKVCFQAAACTAAVSVSTPSRSNRHAVTPSGKPRTTDRLLTSRPLGKITSRRPVHAGEPAAAHVAWCRDGSTYDTSREAQMQTSTGHPRRDVEAPRPSVRGDPRRGRGRAPARHGRYGAPGRRGLAVRARRRARSRGLPGRASMPFRDGAALVANNREITARLTRTLRVVERRHSGDVLASGLNSDRLFDEPARPGRRAPRRRERAGRPTRDASSARRAGHARRRRTSPRSSTHRPATPSPVRRWADVPGRRPARPHPRRDGRPARTGPRLDQQHITPGRWGSYFLGQPHNQKRDAG